MNGRNSREALDSFFHTIELIGGILVATAGGVITYRALYIEPKSAVVITDNGIRELPNQARVIGGALLFVGGSALALYAATRRAK